MKRIAPVFLFSVLSLVIFNLFWQYQTDEQHVAERKTHEHSNSDAYSFNAVSQAEKPTVTISDYESCEIFKTKIESIETRLLKRFSRSKSLFDSLVRSNKPDSYTSLIYSSTGLRRDIIRLGGYSHWLEDLRLFKGRPEMLSVNTLDKLDSMLSKADVEGVRKIIKNGELNAQSMVYGDTAISYLMKFEKLSNDDLLYIIDGVTNFGLYDIVTLILTRHDDRLLTYLIDNFEGDINDFFSWEGQRHNLASISVNSSNIDALVLLERAGVKLIDGLSFSALDYFSVTTYSNENIRILDYLIGRGVSTSDVELAYFISLNFGQEFSKVFTSAAEQRVALEELGITDKYLLNIMKTRAAFEKDYSEILLYNRHLRNNCNTDFVAVNNYQGERKSYSSYAKNKLSKLEIDNSSLSLFTKKMIALSLEGNSGEILKLVNESYPSDEMLNVAILSLITMKADKRQVKKIVERTIITDDVVNFILANSYQEVLYDLPGYDKQKIEFKLKLLQSSRAGRVIDFK